MLIQACCYIADFTAGNPSTSGSNYRNPFVVDGFDSENDSDEPVTFSSSTTSRPIFTTPTRPARSIGSTPRNAHCRAVPKGVFVGKWRHSGLALHAANAVYASRDTQNRVKRRVSKEDNVGGVVVGGRYEPKRTACRHEDILYIARYAGRDKATVG